MKRTISIAVSNQKGGVGKSTMTVLLASYLHYRRGCNVAVVDCDTHQHSLTNMRKRDMQTVERSDYYKQLIVEQWERTQKKAYPIVESSPQQARDTVDELIAQRPDLDIVLVDLPGSVDSQGVFSTILNMDYVLTPIVADRIVMQSTLSFSTAVLDTFKGREDIPLKEFLFFWNKVDRRVSTEVFDAYTTIMQRLNLRVMQTVIPESRRFDKELSVAGGKTYFRCTLLPPPARQLKGSNLDALAEEIVNLIEL
ncbi:MAG: ParA family protein [Bacteroides cellulosilyticus]|nr:ParA family protein [Bacteroides cellulosilyticus]